MKKIPAKKQLKKKTIKGKKKKPKSAKVKVYCQCCQLKITLPKNEAETLTPKHLLITKNEKGKLYICNAYQNWVCEGCIESGRAVKAKGEKQFCGTNFPYYAYIDQHKTCIDCQEHFTFSAKEQQYWYETLQFYIDAKPVRCLPCRKKLRASKQLNTELSNLIKGLDAKDKQVLKRIIEIYEIMEKEDKVKYYNSLYRKLK